jgi:hypothetical protein
VVNKIIHGDCLEVMRSMEPASVDLVFGSPPYEDARTYGIGFKKAGQDWVDWMVEVFRASLRVSTGLVAFVVEGRTKVFQWTATPALLMADLHRAGICLRKPPVYHRVGIPGSGGPDWLRNDYEFIICATNGGKLAWSDNTACGHPPKYAPGGACSHRLSSGTRVNQWGASAKSTGRERRQNGERCAGDLKPSHIITTVSDGVVIPVKANPGNVITCKVGGGHMGHSLACENEAPFPLSLPEFFVRSFCPPGGTVLDPFSGSGTTGHAAEIHGRNYIGIDIRESQVELSGRRLADVGLPLLEGVTA